MRRDTSLAIFGILGLGALLAAKSYASYAPSGWFTDLPVTEPPPGSTEVPLDEKVAAMLATIRRLESNGDYYILNGNRERFTSTATHPNRIGAGGTSTAAGAYQITYPTFVDFSRYTGISDFSPASQDQLAYAILLSTGAIEYLDADDLAGAVRLAGQRWTALRNNNMTLVALIYSDNLG